MAVPMKTTNGNRKLILDVDTGIDDALALAYLASFNNIEILASSAPTATLQPTLPYTTRLTYWNGWGSGTFRYYVVRHVPPGRPRSFPTQVARSSMVRMGWADSVRLLALLPLLACPILVKRTSGSPIRHPMCPILQNRTFRAPRTPSMRPIRVNRTFPVPSALLMCPIQENRTLE